MLLLLLSWAVPVRWAGNTRLSRSDRNEKLPQRFPLLQSCLCRRQLCVGATVTVCAFRIWQTEHLLMLTEQITSHHFSWVTSWVTTWTQSAVCDFFFFFWDTYPFRIPSDHSDALKLVPHLALSAVSLCRQATIYFLVSFGDFLATLAALLTLCKVRLEASSQVSCLQTLLDVRISREQNCS